MKRNIEYTLYRCKLEISEVKRLGYNLEKLIEVAILIEDRRFYSHRGVSALGMARAAAQYIWRGKRSGASTITQQLARSNFLEKLSPPWRRKLVEIALSRWLESFLSKNEILVMYLATSRFDANIFGFHHATHHFLDGRRDLGASDSFVLIERLANMNSGFLGFRVQALLKQMLSKGVLNQTNLIEVCDRYQKMLDNNQITNTNGPSPAQLKIYFDKLS